MQDYRVELETFSGPLDLLLFLLKKDEIDLFDIPVARVTEQYLVHLKQLEEIDVDLAGEFLVMAATLLELKTAMLLPKAAPTDGQGDRGPTAEQALDPRYDLVQQLLAYKRFKDLAAKLDQRADTWARRQPRRPIMKLVRKLSDEELLSAAQDENFGNIEHDQDSARAQEFDLDDISILDLAQAFERIMESIGSAPSRHDVLYDDTPIGLHAEDLIDRLTRDGAMTLQQVFEGRSRSERIGLFLALLELVRQRRLRVEQDDLTAPVKLELRPPEDALAASQQAQETNWIDAQSGQAQYDWPDEATQKAAERRLRLRAKWAEKKKAGEVDGTFDEAAQDLADSSHPSFEADPSKQDDQTQPHP